MEFFKIRKDIPFMRHALIFNAVSLITFLAAVFFLFSRGLHLSVEFTGGTVMEVGYSQPADLEKVRSVVAAQGFAADGVGGESSGIANGSSQLALAVQHMATSAGEHMQPVSRVRQHRCSMRAHTALQGLAKSLADGGCGRHLAGRVRVGLGDVVLAQLGQCRVGIGSACGGHSPRANGRTEQVHAVR